jgi:hypothetical protein
MCAVRNLNPRPTPRQGVALPTELTALCLNIQKKLNKNKPHYLKREVCFLSWLHLGFDSFKREDESTGAEARI